MNRSLLTRLVALLVIIVASVYYIAFDAVGVKLWWNEPFTVKVQLKNAGGLYSDAYVTYRGVEVGKVKAIDLKPTMVIAVLAIDKGEKIPLNVTAAVRELTAASEQYIDLTPTSNDPPYLYDGYTIREDRTSVPVTVGTLLNTVNSLINSLHANDLNTISQTLGTGLENAGNDLRDIITDGRTLLEALQQAEGGTVSLIDNGNTVLSTLAATGNEFEGFSQNLNVLSSQLVQSNSDLISLLKNGDTATSALAGYMSKYNTSTAQLIDDLSVINGLATANEPGFNALLEVLPVFATNIASTASGGTLRFELDFNTQNTVCPYTTQMAEPTSLVATADLNLNCGTHAADLLQRGADKAPAPQGG
jgi:phospholipid/cholesterol/gamma-HCH transport system substrate-binding protein